MPCGAILYAACRRRPPFVADATTFPQLRWWDYGYSALCHMTLQGSGELTFPSGGGAVGRRGAFPRAKPGLLVFPSRQRRGCLV